MSKVAAPARTSINRSPSSTGSPSATNHKPSVARGTPSSGMRIGLAIRHHLFGVITGANEWSGDDLPKSEQTGANGDVIELRGRHKARDGNVLERRGEILAEGQDVATDFTQIG